MSTALIIQDSKADYTAAFAAAGITPQKISDFDFFPQTGLVAYYDFSDAAGTTLTDAFNGNNGVINGSSWAADGKSILLTAASTSFIQTPVLQTLDHEVILLMKETSSGGSGIITGPWTSGAGTSLFADTTGQLGLVTQNASTNGLYRAGNQTADTILNKWRVIGQSHESVAGARNIYTDVATYTATTAVGNMVASGLTWTIGANQGNGGGQQIAGQVAAAMFYSRQLTAVERAKCVAYLATVATSKGYTIGAA